jgi:hypothetical protein
MTQLNGKSMKFRALAEQRVSIILKMLRRIGKLSRRGSYEYSPEQVDKMFKMIRTEVDEAERKFLPPDKNAQGTLFRFD